jgi:hypothetical protein
MKKTSSSRLLPANKLELLIALISILWLSVATNCLAQPNDPKQAGGALPGGKPGVSAEKNSFREVTSKLDAGGDLYLYLGTEQWLNGISAKIAGGRQLLSAIPDLKQEDREHLSQVIDVLTNLVKSSGIEDVSGVGLSSIAWEKDFYHTKAVVHHYPGKGEGFVWSLFGKKSHPLNGLDFMPTNTAMAMFSDLDIPLLWSVVRKQVTQAGIPQVEEALGKATEGFEKATGLKWDQVLGSLGGEFGFALTLDETHKVSIPLPGNDEPLEIPDPAFMLVAKVKDDTIFNRIDQALKKSGQQIFSTDKPNLKMRTLALPLPLPIQLGPTVALSEGYLFIATTDLIIQNALAVKAGEKPGLKTTTEFKRLARDVPTQGNHFTFLSERLGRTINAIQRRAMPMAAMAPTGQQEILKSFLSSDKSTVLYTVGANTDEGWLTVANGNQHPAKLFLASAVAPAAIVAAMALPAMAKARQSATRNACINNLRQIEGAKQTWALENKKPDNATPDRSDLLPYLNARQFPVCPAGGEYTVNPVSDKPQCTKPGHSLGD